MKYRLPSDIIPNHYILDIKPHIKTFNGKVRIFAQVNKSTSQIILNGVDLTIINVKIKDYTTSIQYDSELEFIYILTDKPLKIGPIVLEIEYKGLISNNLKGLYKGEFLNKEVVLATQFESIYARHCFPCFDEPQYKATFDLILTINHKDDAFSNMKVKSRTEVNNRLDRVIFETTPIMSTYLLAFVIGKYIKIGDKISLIVQHNNESDAQFGLMIAKKSLGTFEKILNIKYSLPKLDLVSLPDFDEGAMENWGLVTFRQLQLLYNPTYSTTSDQYNVALTIAHELSHQFFGDLCTTFWWNSIWLNEGFATYFEYVGVDSSMPEWDIWSLFFTDVQQDALSRDCFLTTHPLDTILYNNNEIDEIFDMITYNKGASILYMVSDILGPEVLYQKLHNYLDQCKYGSTTSDILWKSLDNLDMKAWTYHSGFPLITVKEYPNGIRLKQRRYLPHSKSKDDNIWWISTKIFCESSEPLVVTFKSRKSPLIHINPKKLYKINYGQGTFCRVNYPIETWYRIINTPSIIDRCGLLNDLLTFSLDGKLPIDVALDLTYHILHIEKEYEIWNSAIDGIYRLDALFIDDPCAHHFRNYMVQLLNGINGWIWNPPRRFKDFLLQPMLLSLCIYFKEPHISETCNELFLKWLIDPSILSINILSSILNHAVHNMGDFAFDLILKRYLNETNIYLKSTYLYALTSSKDPKLLKTLLELSLNTDIIKLQDRIDLIMSISSNPYGQMITWEFVKTNWESFDTRRLHTLIKNVTKNFSTYDLYHDVRTFFVTHIHKSPHEVNRALEQIHYNIIWRSLHIHKACDWLKQFS